MIKIVLLRHGQSEWNQKGLFTGWTDVDLTNRGISEAKEAGRKMLEAGFVFDLAFTSHLKRASKTLDLALTEMNQNDIEIIVDWRLNERHYGNLQGLNKKETAEKLGEEQVFIWRRSYDTRPPAIEDENQYNQKDDPRYKDIEVPSSESLKDVVERVRAFWEEKILPELKKEKQILISASGNSLRAMVKYLDNVPADEIARLNIPTGVPLVYELNESDDYKPIKNYYLENEEELEKRINEVKNQAKNK